MMGDVGWGLRDVGRCSKMCEDACSCTKRDRRLVLRTLGVYNKYEKCQQNWYDNENKNRS
ncbi:MAG: hypothetical protein J6J23_06435 [Clostridia bacterium]|nr:hypothetical protein [Clostridia bacterium]